MPTRSAPGFLVNRVLMPYMTEAMLIAGEGVPLAAIDDVAVRFGMPMGPIELADIVGLDVCLHVGRILAAAYGGPAPDAVAPLVAAGKLGKKSGQGLYEWRDGKPVKPPAAPAAQVPDDLEDRLMLALVNEAMAVLREGVVADADLIDAGVIFGSGFAPFRGGPLRYAAGARRCRSRRAPGSARGAAWRTLPPRPGLGELQQFPRGVIPSGTVFDPAFMSSDPNTVELSFLRAFSPLDGLKNENLRALARKTVVRELTQGRLLFKEGDTDKRTYYLASGLVELLSNGKVVGTDPRRHARRAASARAHPAPPLLGPRGLRQDRIPVDRQRPARRADHLGPDRHL